MDTVAELQRTSSAAVGLMSMDTVAEQYMVEAEADR